MDFPTKNIEEVFLKIFKVTVLFIMGMALLAIVILLATALYQFSQSPKEPAPAQKARVKEIGIDDLRKFLIDKEDSRKEAMPKQKPAGGDSSLRYLEETTALYRCAVEFGKKTGEEIEATSNAENAKIVENLRDRIEKASESTLRGEPWVKATLSFTCKALADSSIIELKKEQKVKSVFMPILEFHVRSWDQIQSEKIKFEQQEENRVVSQRNAEVARVLMAKALAIKCLIAAVSTFALFMALAIYLLFAKIETDLRDINETIKGKKSTELN